MIKLTGRKKSVTRKKSGGRQKPNTVTLTGRKGTKGRREVKTIKSPQTDYMTAIDAMTKRVKRKWWVLDKGWDKDPGLTQLAKSDANNIINEIHTMALYELGKIEKEHGDGASYARDAVEMREAKAFLSQRDPKWGPERLSWVAAELEDRNYHLVANYIRFVEIGEIPYDEYLAFRREHVHKLTEPSVSESRYSGRKVSTRCPFCGGMARETKEHEDYIRLKGYNRVCMMSNTCGLPFKEEEK